MNAAATATPPPRGTGRVLTRRASGRSTASIADRDPPDQRRQEERETAAAANATTTSDRDRRRPALGMNLSAVGRSRAAGPAPGTAPPIAATSAGQPAWAAGVVARSIASTMIGRSSASRPGPKPGT